MNPLASMTGVTLLGPWDPSQNIKTVFPRYGDSHVKDETVGWGRLTFNMGNAILVRRHLYTETAPRWAWLACATLTTLPCNPNIFHITDPLCGDTAVQTHSSHRSAAISPLSSGACDSNFKMYNFQKLIVNSSVDIRRESIQSWMQHNLINEKSALVQIMARSRQATPLYPSQCWPSSVLSYGVIRLQWVKKLTYLSCTLSQFVEQ